jgi:hypothetical protein
MFWLSKKARRDAIRHQPTPPEWRTLIDKNLPYVRLLAPADREELDGLVKVFLAEKRFEGCGGLSVTDEMRVTIAAQASLLLLHRQTDVYPELETILIYPHPYRAPESRQAGPLVVQSEGARLGESWARDVVVLAWDHVNAATHPVEPGHNLVLHEFAHQLDAENGAMDGAPPLDGRARYVAWARALGEEYAELAARLQSGRSSDIDPYGATNPAEFFAVLTEMFFEAPRSLARAHPQLYGELSAFYGQDPAALRERQSGMHGARSASP